MSNVSASQPYALVSHRIQRYGGDAAWAFGSYTLRTELAYTRTGKTGVEFSGNKVRLPASRGRLGKTVCQ